MLCSDSMTPERLAPAMKGKSRFFKVIYIIKYDTYILQCYIKTHHVMRIRRPAPTARSTPPPRRGARPGSLQCKDLYNAKCIVIYSLYHWHALHKNRSL